MPTEPSRDERAAMPEQTAARARGAEVPASEHRAPVVLRTVANPRRTRL